LRGTVGRMCSNISKMEREWVTCSGDEAMGAIYSFNQINSISVPLNMAGRLIHSTALVLTNFNINPPKALVELS
jgi:hypothetical protein